MGNEFSFQDSSLDAEASNVKIHGVVLQPSSCRDGCSLVQRVKVARSMKAAMARHLSVRTRIGGAGTCALNTILEVLRVVDHASNGSLINKFYKPHFVFSAG